MSQAISFASPSMRASGSDLTVAISPLGLVELADEEFEVHGPRLNRYAQNWAWYLGHHWGYRREVGEPQLTFNYVKAFADFINNFTFSRSVQFRTPEITAHIIPALLQDIWEVQNNKDQVLWEMANQGGVSGDVFVKVAWEPGFTDPAGNVHEDRVRILPLNASFCFPEYHPHDRDRLIRFKLKYRFWGTSPEGTRQVYTYTEILTDDVIEEYVNDELIDSRPNPLGTIPIVHIANIPVSSSPWGLADIADVIPLNREYNEKATDISDIINYHAAPITIITGAKASNLERGAKKVWGGLPEKANVFNLENGVDLNGPLTYLELLKRAMHEMTGVPETALGQIQAVSNTSGVALAIQYQPMMQRYNLKKLQYTTGIQKINALALHTLFLYHPETLKFNPQTNGIMKEGQPPELDPLDPIIYRTTIHWPSPLPLDKLIKLNELMVEIQLGLQSKRGALRELGEEFPDEKMDEIFEEQWEEAKEEGVLQLQKMQIASVILALTGLNPVDGTEPEPTKDAEGNEQKTGGPDPNSVSMPATASDPLAIATASEHADLLNELVTRAYGTKLPQRRTPDNTD